MNSKMDSIDNSDDDEVVLKVKNSPRRLAGMGNSVIRNVEK